MSKSLGNMVFVRDLLTKYDANVIRWYLLSKHYRSEWEFDEEEIGKVLLSVRKLIRLTGDSRGLGKEKADEVFQFLDNDLDTPGALGQLLRFSKSNPKAAKIIGSEIFGFRFN